MSKSYAKCINLAIRMWDRRFTLGTIYSVTFEIAMTVRIYNKSGQRYVGTLSTGEFHQCFRELTPIERALHFGRR